MDGAPGCSVIIANYEMEKVQVDVEKAITKIALGKDEQKEIGLIFKKILRQLTAIKEMNMYMSEQ